MENSGEAPTSGTCVNHGNDKGGGGVRMIKIYCDENEFHDHVDMYNGRTYEASECHRETITFPHDGCVTYVGNRAASVKYSVVTAAGDN